MGDPFTIENVEVAVPKKGEVRVQVTSSGICHSDLIMKNGVKPNYHFPAVLGHEGAGIIESVGEGVTSFKPGDAVVMVFESYCGECNYCKDSRTNLCQKTPRHEFQMDGTSRIFCNGREISQAASLSTFSEYTVTSEYNVAKINPKANLNDIALIGCCIPTGYGAAMNAAKVSRGATCAIWGLGGVGMCVVMGCRDSGASKIVGIDTNPRKFKLAKELGCTECLDSKEDDIPKLLAEMTNDEGVDFCFVAVGNTLAMEQAFESSHRAWGKTVVIGATGLGERVGAKVWDLIYGRSLIGTVYGSYKAKLAVPDLVEKVLDGQIQLDKLISHRIPLDKINDGFAMLRTGESLRTIINYNLEI